MADKKAFRTLTFQMMAVLCAAALAAVLVGAGCYVTGTAMVQHYYFSEEAVSRRMTKEIDSFREYVAENEIASTDVTAVEKWNRDHRYTQLTIKGLQTTISSNYNGAELMGTETGLLVQSGQVASSGMEFPVNFSDGGYPVVIYESSDTMIYDVLRVSCVFAGTLIFLVIVLLYDQRLSLSIQTLSRQIRQVSLGNLDRQISSGRRDEIGQLAQDVDHMRLSIIEKLQQEEAAWQANSQLITAISHDVRTPLTALMGYLELLDDESIPWEERLSYLEICKNNAQRLKSLTDELFGFFLVFGKPKPDQNIEEFDCGTLLDQILMEHEMSLRQQGFDVRPIQQEAATGKLRVDLSHIRRVFDNLFSNVRKYADKDKPVGILQTVEDGRLHVTISNAIAATQERVESNKIGLQTCRKLIDSMGGEFHQSRSKDSFTAEVILPIY